MLNNMQQQAVLQIDGPVLVLAGAGSGKTRVITYRIAHIIETGVSENRILALTFTNKAAREMKERVNDLLCGENSVWVSTFHSFCVSILRKHIESIGYNKNFTIYDDNDASSVVSECIKHFELENYDGYEVKKVKNIIASLKNDNISVKEFENKNKGNFYMLDIAKIYDLYEQRLKANNSLDFNDLLSKTLKIFTDNKDILDYYSDRFMYIHVDEYQDTNRTQYQLVKMLANKHGNICVVGDDDQSIYGWRGANIKNILDFEKDFFNAKTIRLEQNYRSTNVILDAANSVIKNNTERKSKKLWTNQDGGEKIKYYRADSERDEANYVLKQIKSLISNNQCKYNDIAVLYRTNTQSRIIEEFFLKGGIPYSVYGGFKFYSRKEIKDVIAYLTVIQNPDDQIAMRRIINTPKRGIGDSTIEKIVEYSIDNSCSFYDAICNIESIDIKKGAKDKIKVFLDKFNELIALSAIMPIGQFVSKLVEQMGLISQYEVKITEENTSKKNNIIEFISAATEFENTSSEANLLDFLENIMLVTDMDNSDDNQEKVSLMTMHSAKGLEYDVVFIIGMEKNIFPSFMSMSENKLEEERRLCYVGITRAKKQLYITNAFSRMQFGRQVSNEPSMFIQEIPSQLIKKENVYSSSSKPTTQKQKTSIEKQSEIKGIDQSQEISIGQKVRHKKFGIGTVIRVEGSGDNRLISVAFDDVGIKKLSTAFAPLEII